MPGERREKLREYVELHGEATITELEELSGGCSPMTLWRDLKRLEEEGVLRRVRGGVVATRLLSIEVEGMYSQRAAKNVTAKRAIAREALRFVSEGRSLFFDAGSTIMALAQLLPDKHYTILTSGANVAVELSQRHSCTSICMGGQVSGNTLSCSGPQAEAFLASVNIDVALMASSGYTLACGFTSGSAAEYRLKQQVIQKAATVVMLLDAGKLGVSLPYTFAAMQDIDVLICDIAPPQDILEEANRRNVEVVVAEKKKED